jgi:hypothetical protein
MKITTLSFAVFFYLLINNSSAFSLKHRRTNAGGFKGVSGLIPKTSSIRTKYQNEAGRVSSRIPQSSSSPRSSETLLHAFPPNPNQILSYVSRGSLNIASLLHQDDVYVLSIVMLLSTFGLSLERRTKIGKALSVSELDFCISYSFF